MTKNPQTYSGVVKLKLAGFPSGDPILNVFTRARIHPLLIGVIYILVVRLAQLFAAWRVGHLRTVGVTTGYFDDPTTYTAAIFGAAVVAYYAWIPRGILSVFKGLYDNGVIGSPIATDQKMNEKKQSERPFTDKVLTSFRGWWWPVISMLAATAAMITLLLPRYRALGQSAWWTADTLNLIIVLLLHMLTAMYCAILLLIYSVLTIYWLGSLFSSFRIHIRPLYPDRAGGLAPLGSFTLTTSYLIAILGMMFVVTPITRNYLENGTLQFLWTTELYIGLATYIVAAPVVFFAPLSVAHNHMKEEKNKLLQKIAQQFEAEYRNVHKALRRRPRTTSLENSLQRLRKLQDLYDITSKFPIWPFNAENLARFGTSFLLPILIPLTINFVNSLIH